MKLIYRLATMLGLGILVGHLAGDSWPVLLVPVVVIWALTFIGCIIEDYD